MVSTWFQQRKLYLRKKNHPFKGTLMQIWKYPYIFMFIKWYPENFAFLILSILELFTRKVCIFLKKQATFKSNLLFLHVWKQTFCKIYKWITQGLQRLRIRLFPGSFLFEHEHTGRFSNLYYLISTILKFGYNLNKTFLEVIG